MVDFQSICAYADSDAADSSSWLNDMEKSRKMVLKGGRYEASCMHSMSTKYPTYFFRQGEEHHELHDHQDVGVHRVMARKWYGGRVQGNTHEGP